MSSSNNALAAQAAGEFSSLTRKPASSFITANIPAPTQVYVPPDGFFRVNIQNTFTGAQVIINIRTLRADDGTITVSQDTLLPSNGGNTNTFFLPGVEGFVLSVSAFTPNLSLRRGQTFVSIQLGSGSQQDFHLQQVLVQDYIAQGYAAGWPGGTIKLPTEGPGRLVRGNLNAYAAGSEIADQMTANLRWRVAAVTLGFSASVAAGNRVIQFFFDDNLGSTVYSVDIPGNIAPGTNTIISLTAGSGPPSVNNNGYILPIPENFIFRNPYRFRTLTTNLGVADQYSNIVYHAEEWVDS